MDCALHRALVQMDSFQHCLSQHASMTFMTEICNLINMSASHIKPCFVTSLLSIWHAVLGHELPCTCIQASCAPLVLKNARSCTHDVPGPKCSCRHLLSPQGEHGSPGVAIGKEGADEARHDTSESEQHRNGWHQTLHNQTIFVTRQKMAFLQSHLSGVACAGQVCRNSCMMIDSIDLAKGQ